MTDKTNGTIDTLVDDLERGLKTPEQFSLALRTAPLPTDKNTGKVDYTALIRYISDKGKEYAANNKTDPLQSTPADNDIKHVLETDGVIENGQFTQAGINQIVGLYTQGATTYANTRFQGGMLRSSTETDKADSTKLANGTGNFDVVSEVNKAHDQEGVLRAVSPALSDLMDKARNAAARGRLKQYMDGLKSYLASSGHAAPAYAGAHK